MTVLLNTMFSSLHLVSLSLLIILKSWTRAFVYVLFNPCHAEYFYIIHHFYPINLQHSSCKHVFSIRVENIEDPDRMASLEAR